MSYKGNRVVTDGFKRSTNDQSLKGFKAMVIITRCLTSVRNRFQLVILNSLNIVSAVS